MSELFFFRVKVLVFIGLGLCFIQGTTSRTTPHHFMAYIIQDGKQLPIEKHVVQAKKSPFQIVIDMPETKGVFVSASFKPNTYNPALKNVEVSKLPGYKDVAIYELWKNPNNELFVEGSTPSFWFINSPSKHRFSYYEKINNRFICTREVEKFYDLDKHNEISFSKIKNSLYLTFVKFEREGDNYRSKELMRHNFKIEWID